MNSIRLKTALPGPKSVALMVERRQQVARGPFHATPVYMDRAEGALIHDVDGNTLIDFACGIGVTNLGHAPAALVEKVRERAGQVLHAGFNVTPYESYIRVCEKLNQHMPGSFAKKSLLVNSGAEAVENAIKFAKAYTGRQAVVCFDHGYHGRTYMAMSLTSKVKPYKYQFGAMMSDVFRVPFPYAYRWPTSGDVAKEAFARFEEVVTSQISPDQVAAVILEPVLGEGGFVPAPREFLKKLREFCTANKIVLIADEIQTGFGRTGTLFASEQLGFEPDLMTTAKGLAGGLPLAAVTGRAEIMDAPMDGGVGGTYGGNPVACASALAVFETFEKTDILERSRKLGETLLARLKSWQEKYPLIGEVRGLGPMLAMEFVKNRTTKEPFKEAAGAVIKSCYENGLVVLSAGTAGNCVRLLLPLVISPEQLEEGLTVLEKAIAGVKLP